MKMLIVVLLLAIVASLGHALVSMSLGRKDSKAMVRALTVRITLSIALFAILMIGWYTGHLQPHGVR